MIDDQTKLVFISYSREKSDYVRNIVERLLGDGIQVYFDQYDLKQGNHLIPYMEKSVNDPNVDFVLVFCDKFCERLSGQRPVFHDRYVIRNAGYFPAFSYVVQVGFNPLEGGYFFSAPNQRLEYRFEF